MKKSLFASAMVAGALSVSCLPAHAGTITIPGVTLPAGISGLPALNLGGGGSVSSLAAPSLSALTALLTNNPLTSALQGTPLAPVLTVVNLSALDSLVNTDALLGLYSQSPLSGLLSSDIPALNITYNGTPLLPVLDFGSLPNLPSVLDLAISGGLGGDTYFIQPTKITSSSFSTDVALPSLL